MLIASLGLFWYIIMIYIILYVKTTIIFYNLKFAIFDKMLTPILISSMINKELSWYKDVVDYVGDEEEPDNDHTFVRSLAEIQSPYS